MHVQDTGIQPIAAELKDLKPVLSVNNRSPVTVPVGTRLRLKWVPESTKAWNDISCFGCTLAQITGRNLHSITTKAASKLQTRKNSQYVAFAILLDEDKRGMTPTVLNWIQLRMNVEVIHNNLEVVPSKAITVRQLRDRGGMTCKSKNDLRSSYEC